MNDFNKAVIKKENNLLPQKQKGGEEMGYFLRAYSEGRNTTLMYAKVLLKRVLQIHTPSSNLFSIYSTTLRRMRTVH